MDDMEFFVLELGAICFWLQSRSGFWEIKGLVIKDSSKIYGHRL